MEQAHNHARLPRTLTGQWGAFLNRLFHASEKRLKRLLKMSVQVCQITKHKVLSIDWMSGVDKGLRGRLKTQSVWKRREMFSIFTMTAPVWDTCSSWFVKVFSGCKIPGGLHYFWTYSILAKVTPCLGPLKFVLHVWLGCTCLLWLRPCAKLVSRDLYNTEGFS